jgi:hypothetical protein
MQGWFYFDFWQFFGIIYNKKIYPVLAISKIIVFDAY